MGASTNCPFCSPAAQRIWMKSEHALALPDGFPVTEGHTLVIPRRHVASVFDLTDEEQIQVWTFVAQVRDRIETEYRPDGFNIGLNDGSAAGQTVSHAHIHVIPRRDGDVADPRGGLRWIIPEKAPYWNQD